MHTYGMTMVLIDFKFSHHHGHLWCIHRLYLGTFEEPMGGTSELIA
jgi:hypothetical protein